MIVGGTTSPAGTYEVAAEVARSWLLVPGSRPELFGPAMDSGADQVVLDIEDAVDPTAKGVARSDVVAWLDSGASAWVRVNDRNSEFWGDDVDALRLAPGLRGVMLAKVESADQVAETFVRLGGNTRVLALIESAQGIEFAPSIAQAEGAFRLAFGSGDYRRDTGASADDLAMSYPRSRLVIASRIGKLPGPIDGPTVGTSHSVLRRQSEMAVALGLTGKLVLDARQVTVVNEAISPTESDRAWASEFLAEFEARGRVIRDGSDRPRLGRAEKITGLANALGMDR